MKNIILVIAQLSIVVSVGAQAQELRSVTDARAKSFSGANFEQAKREVQAVRGVRDAKKIADIATRLVGKGLLATRSKNRGVQWTTDAHPSLARILLRREPNASVAPLTPDDALQELRSSQGKASQADVSARAEDVAQALHAEGAFPAEETFVLVHEGQQVISFVDPTGKQEALVTKYRRVYRRYVDGVPVTGRAGEFQIHFDADGAVEEIEVPTDSYTVTGKVLPKLVATTGLDRVTKRGGFDHRLTSVNQKLRHNGEDSNVDEMQCGYMDDESKAKLDRGCFVRYHAHGLFEDLVSAE